MSRFTVARCAACSYRPPVAFVCATLRISSRISARGGLPLSTAVSKVPSAKTAHAMSTVTDSTGENILVSPSWLVSKMYDGSVRRGDVVILDGSWHMPASGRNPRAEFLGQRIPAARFFGIDDIKDHNTNLPHMLPTAEEFASAVAKLGVRPESHIVAYDVSGVFSACRVYWTFRAFNHPGPISILHGGLPVWVRDGYPRTYGPEDVVEPTPAEDLRRVYRLNRDLVRTYDQIARNISTGEEQVIDARPPERFTGRDPDPRPGIPSGHIPGSLSVPFNSVLWNPGTLDGTMFLDQEVLKRVFSEKGVMNKPVVTSCGSGITASILYVALQLAGAKGRVSLYDGSWIEYAGKPGSRIEKTA